MEEATNLEKYVVLGTLGVISILNVYQTGDVNSPREYVMLMVTYALTRAGV